MWKWLLAWFGVTSKAQFMSRRGMPLKRLWWLADAPLFLDEELVASFYDAIVRPEFELHGKTVGTINEATTTLLVGGSAEAELGLPSFLTTILPDAKVKGGGQIERTKADGSQTSSEYDWKIVQTAGRKLEELVAVYVGDKQFHDRLVFMDCPTSDVTTLAGNNLTLSTLAQANDSFPRSLVFLEVQPGAAIIPTMCEFSDGGLEPLYEKLIGKLWKDDENKPKYTDSSRGRTSDERLTYWNAISERYNSRVAMEVLEEAVSEKRKLEWVDFRLRLNTAGETLHLHVCARGRYATGTFGYNFIRRGDRKGVRIVGSLKRGPDLNVLAIFEC